MLVLSRKIGEKVVIGGDITVTVVEIRGNRVRLAFDAPREYPILRAELADRCIQPMQEWDMLDPDLANKPAEWNEIHPCAVL